ncbi:hypothetical protein I302_107662 [Kwoniella bestiolae CBS 10118]|uniref:Uncharacterized protein n=1 Tax=Kwoniella bestiolae CBS 10118 TaxID=1296100 RepID=A0A1B9FXX6_9TREE|nr:hypothetical protein I302_06599 [Kwoniella bestiolae CBS 10118]OCF23616.1 hypothetical protein I302_06599 [Kwoniella bestiolae CBS 10118]
MKIPSSQPKLIFSTRRTKDQPIPISNPPSRPTLLQKTKSFITPPSSSTRSPTTFKPTSSFEKKGLKYTTKHQSNQFDQISDEKRLNENQIRKQPPTPPTPDQPRRSKSSRPSSEDEDKEKAQSTQRQSLDDGLAICLFGYSVQAQTHQVDRQLNGDTPISTKTNDFTTAEVKEEKVIGLSDTADTSLSKIPSSLLDMYDSTYEEEVRQQAVMAEVLPDAEMWAKWEKTEAPLRQGRGWYPRLDRHFLELLVISEIHALSRPLTNSPSPPGQADRIHRHASRVRRVACERIGAERLNAYCERVKEAFEAYMMGGWSGAGAHALAQAHQGQVQDEDQMNEENGENEEAEIGGEVEEDQDEERRRSMTKGKGSSFGRNEREEMEVKVPRINVIPSQETDSSEEADGEEERGEDENVRSEDTESDLELREIQLSELQERSNEGSENQSTTGAVYGEDSGMDVDLSNSQNEKDDMTYSSIVKDNKFLTLNKIKDS